MRPPRCQLDFVISRVRSAIPDVLEKTAMKQVRVLRYERYGSSEALLRDLTNVLGVDANGAFVHIVHAQQQAHERGFTGAARPDESDALPRRDGELEGFDDIARMPGSVLGEGVVRERDALETNAAPRHRELRCAGLVHNR